MAGVRVDISTGEPIQFTPSLRAVFIFSKKYTLFQTTLLSWFIGFVFMWLVVANLGVLPFETLFYAIPLSILEAFLATYVIFKFNESSK